MSHVLPFIVESELPLQCRPIAEVNRGRRCRRTSWSDCTATCRSLPFLACVAGASAFLSSPVAVPGTARYNGAVSARSGLPLRTSARPTVALRKNTAVSMQTATGVDTAALAKAANEARGLAMDSIAAAKSGHLGLPLGCAEVIFPVGFAERSVLVACVSLWSVVVTVNMAL